jgi:hypothetical protein
MKKYFHVVVLAALIAGLIFSPPSFAASMGMQIDFLLSQVRSSAGSLAGGKVYFFSAGGSTPKDVYLDINKTAPAAANPYTLDANGTALLYGDGLYRIVINTAAGATVFDRDNIRLEDFIRGATGTPDNTTFLRGDDSWFKIPRFWDNNAFSDNLVLYATDAILKGPPVDVRSYRVTGQTVDNVTNAQAAINAASYGQTVVFHDNLALTSSLTGKTGVNLLGLGITMSSTAAAMSYIINLDNVTDVSVSGFTFTTGTTLTGASCETGIRIATGSQRIKVFNNYFHDIYIGLFTQLEQTTNSDIQIFGNAFYRMGNLAIGVNNRGTTGVKIYGNTFTNCGFTQGAGTIGGAIEIRGNTGTIVTNNHFYHLTDNSYPNDGVRVENVSESPAFKGSHNVIANNVMDDIGGNGVRVTDCDNTLINGNQIRNVATTANGGAGYSGSGVFMASSASPANYASIINNIIDNTVTGINYANGTAYHNFIALNTILNSSNAGMYLLTTNSTIISNKVRGSGTLACIAVYADNNYVANNELVDGPAVYGGIMVLSSKNTIKDNYIYDTKGVMTYGIWVGAYTGNVIRNNEINGMATNRIFLEATTAFAGNFLSHQVAVPASKAAICNPGDWAMDNTYIYRADPSSQFAPFNWTRSPAFDNNAW